MSASNVPRAIAFGVTLTPPVPVPVSAKSVAWWVPAGTRIGLGVAAVVAVLAAVGLAAAELAAVGLVPHDASMAARPRAAAHLMRCPRSVMSNLLPRYPRN